MRLELSPLAESDLEAIGDYIAVDSPDNAFQFIRKLQEQCKRFAKSPMAYVARPELGERLRSCAPGRYVIFFPAWRKLGSYRTHFAQCLGHPG